MHAYIVLVNYGFPDLHKQASLAPGTGSVEPSFGVRLVAIDEGRWGTGNDPMDGPAGKACRVRSSCTAAARDLRVRGPAGVLFIFAGAGKSCMGSLACLATSLPCLGSFGNACTQLLIRGCLGAAICLNHKPSAVALVRNQL